MAARQTYELSVVGTERPSPHMVRLELGGPGYAEFTDNQQTDAYVKLAFPTGEGEVVRTYTVRRNDPARQCITVDFVVHGESGIAAPWAATARVGDTITVRGPGGAYAPRADADWHLLAGDESALPAISAALEAMPAGAPVKAFVEVAGPEDEIAIDSEAILELTWVHRGGSADEVGDDRAGDNAPLIAAVRDADWLPGTPQVFIHGEAQAVMKNLRGYIRSVRGVPAEWCSISGYWRRGATEDGFRVWKSQQQRVEERAAVVA